MVDKQTNTTTEEHTFDPDVLHLLFEHGQEQGYLSQGDILDFFPDAEQDENLLEEVVEAINESGIYFLDGDIEEDQKAEEPEEEEEAEEDEAVSLKQVEAEDLSSVDTDDLVRLYLREAARVPLLTAEEESDLAQRIERGRMAQEELARGNVTTRRIKELRILIEDGWDARERLIRANARLVISVAKKYIGRGVPFIDLIQEGNIGLMRAAKKFDYRRGYKFSTYATWWIRQAITRAVADQGRTIRLPVHMGDQINRMMRTQHEMQQQLGRVPTTEELAEALEVPTTKIDQMRRVVQQPLSLQMTVGEEDDEEFGEFIEDTSTLAPEDSAMQSMMQADLQERLDALPPRELRILQLRYGLVDGQPMTLNEVGRKMGITRERARQLEAQALRRLRTAGNEQKLRAYTE
jgi:RNA polymerase primary sigma factor